MHVGSTGHVFFGLPLQVGTRFNNTNNTANSY